MKYVYQESIVFAVVALAVSAAVSVSIAYSVIGVYSGAWF